MEESFKPCTIYLFSTTTNKYDINIIYIRNYYKMGLSTHYEQNKNLFSYITDIGVHYQANYGITIMLSSINLVKMKLSII